MTGECFISLAPAIFPPSEHTIRCVMLSWYLTKLRLSTPSRGYQHLCYTKPCAHAPTEVTAASCSFRATTRLYTARRGDQGQQGTGLWTHLHTAAALRSG